MLVPPRTATSSLPPDPSSLAGSCFHACMLQQHACHHCLSNKMRQNRQKDRHEADRAGRQTGQGDRGQGEHGLPWHLTAGWDRRAALRWIHAVPCLWHVAVQDSLFSFPPLPSLTISGIFFLPRSIPIPPTSPSLTPNPTPYPPLVLHPAFYIFCGTTHTFV